METKRILNAANAIKDDLLTCRRVLHQNPEAGPHLPRTAAYVKEQLKSMGYEPVDLCDSGVIATLTGEDTGRCILLRADMDALRVAEKADVPFRSENGCMHACGHDMHAAMLLGAAKLLMQFKDELKGTVKLVFQPDEEGFTGAKTMLAAGVLKNPAPQAGLALHVHSGTPSGLVLCGKGTAMAGCTLFRVTARGGGLSRRDARDGG